MKDLDPVDLSAYFAIVRRSPDAIPYDHLQIPARARTRREDWGFFWRIQAKMAADERARWYIYLMHREGAIE